MFSRGIRQKLPVLIVYTEDTRSLILRLFISVYFQSRLKGELIEEKPKMMIKSSNDSFELNIFSLMVYLQCIDLLLSHLKL